MQSLYDWIQTQMKTLSRHSDTAKAFAYLLKQWEALNVYCSNGWVEIDNNIAENALRGVAVGRKNWLFAGSDSGGEHAAVLYSLIGTCRLNNVEPEKWLRYVIEHIQDWPANRVRDLLPWKVSLYIDLCNCLILICSIQHQMKVNLWTKNSYRLWLTNWPKTSKPLKTSVSLIGC